MNLIFLLSVILKGIGAVLEVLLQILVTARMGVSGYGAYSAWISTADLICWVCFSGIVKCNTFFLSGGRTTIRRFKKRFFLLYMLPLLTLIGAASVTVGGSVLLAAVPVIAMLELLVLDRSSTLIARGKGTVSLLGEYVLGRLILVVGVLLLDRMGLLAQGSLLMLYILQYVLVLCFYLLRQGRAGYTDISDQVSVRKWSIYQRSDLMVSMVAFLPVVMQYFFAGAFEAGVVSVVLLVKKLINFISGPTSKIFLPEFSRLYRAGEKERIPAVYSSIMRIQMLIIGPIAVVLLGFPRVILGILAQELVVYERLFMLCSAIFLVATSLGPCGGVLQMTGRERTDIRIRLASLVVMAAVMVLTSRDPWFILYGLCVQMIVEEAGKFICVCRSLGSAPAGVTEYGLWWLPALAAIGAAYLLGLNDSFWMMALLAVLVFAVSGVRELKDLKNVFLNTRKGGSSHE